ANAIGWQRKIEDVDKERIILLYGETPESLLNPCRFYEKYDGSRVSSERKAEARNVKKCDDLIESRTTISTPTKVMSHFGAEVFFECRNDTFVMLGDETRKCLRNGKWTGIQPVCMPAEYVNSYCTYSSDNNRCEPFYKANERIMHETNSRNIKRSIENHNKQFESEYVSIEMISTTDIICIGLKGLFQRNSVIEVHVKQANVWNLVWDGYSDETFSVTSVQFETNVVKGKTFKVKIVANYRFMLRQMNVLI
ncbi:hypothetical protein B4U80_14204, partial [Leptotrombidium deliense]